MEFVFLPQSFHSGSYTDYKRIRTIFNSNLNEGSNSSIIELLEITLGSNQLHHTIVNTTSTIVPLVGELNIKLNDQINYSIDPGHLFVLNNTIGDIQIENNDLHEPVLFLELKSTFNPPSLSSLIHKIDIDQSIQSLNELQLNASLILSIGKFVGRHDHEYKLNQTNHVGIYIISGAFEVEYRLMEAGDMMMINDIDKDQLEFESLAKESIILILRSTVRIS